MSLENAVKPHSPTFKPRESVHSENPKVDREELVRFTATRISSRTERTGKSSHGSRFSRLNCRKRTQPRGCIPYSSPRSRERETRPDPDRISARWADWNRNLPAGEEGQAVSDGAGAVCKARRLQMNPAPVPSPFQSPDQNRCKQMTGGGKRWLCTSRLQAATCTVYGS